MADTDKPVDSLREINRRNADFYRLPSPPARRDDGTIVDERFPRAEDEIFRRQPGRK